MRYLALLFIVTIFMIFLYGQIDYTAAPYANWDLASYRNMAVASPRIATDVCQPPAFRVLGPYLVGLLPVPDPAGFYAFTVLAAVGLVFLLYYFFRTVGLSAPVSMVTVILYTFNKWWFGLTIWDYFQINDLLSLIWLIVLFLAMNKGHWAIFGVTLFLGALTRETSMLMIPVVVVYLWERKELQRQWRQALTAIVPGFAVFLLLRILIPAPCGKSLFVQLFAHAGSILSPEKIFRLLINSSLPFTFFPLVFFETTRQYFRTRLHTLLFITLVFLSTLFGLAYDERLMAPAFVAVYALIGNVIQEYRSEKIFLATLIVGGFLSSLHHLMARYPLPDRTLTMIFSLGSLLVVTIVALVVRLKRGQSPRAEDMGSTLHSVT